MAGLDESSAITSTFGHALFSYRCNDFGNPNALLPLANHILCHVIDLETLIVTVNCQAFEEWDDMA